MKTLLCSAVFAAVFVCSGSALLSGEEAKVAPAGGRVILVDDFERADGSAEKDGIGNGWETNSASRAKGHKQVTLKNGAMYIATHAEANHGASVRHDAAFTDGSLELRFMLEHDGDILGLDFADLECKEVHAGHLFKVAVGTKKLEIDDSKFGGMSMKFYEQKLAKTLTPEQKKLIAAKKKVFPVDLQVGTWYRIRVDIAGDTVNVLLDGKPVGSSRSEGFAHPTKRMLRLAVPKQAVVDDVKMVSRP